MLQDVHSRKNSIKVVAGPGSTTVIAGVSDAYIYIHEIMGDLDVSGTITLKCGSDVVGEFVLDAGQGLTQTDEPGMDGSPRFMCKPGDGFVLTLSAGSTFKGSIDYSLRY